MTYFADTFGYDAWFDENIPKAQYGSLQCWIANEKTQPWSNAYDMTIHSITVSYTHLTLPTKA